MRTAILLCLLASALVGPDAKAFPRPPDGSEDIPKLMADSVLVCKGEVTEAPEVESTFSPDPPRLTAIAVVHLEKCFKGVAPSNETILVLFDQFIPAQGGDYTVLQKGDYRLLFLTAVGDKYSLTDVWFGSLATSRRLGESSTEGLSPMQSLELDLKAGLQDHDPELVLDSIRMLGNMRHLQSEDELKNLLNSPDSLLRTYIYEALLRLHDYSVLPLVAEWLEAQPSPPSSLLLPRDALFEM